MEDCFHLLLPNISLESLCEGSITLGKHKRYSDIFTVINNISIFSYTKRSYTLINPFFFLLLTYPET